MKKTLVLTAIVAALAVPAFSQSFENEPGYFPLEYLQLIDEESITIEINLEGAMLKMISAFVEGADEEFSDLVSGLKAVYVRSGEFEPDEYSAVLDRVDQGRDWLDGKGWHPFVRIREEGSQVFIYTQEEGDSLLGITVLAIEESEVTAVNLIGRIDPDHIARLMEGFSINVDDLEAEILESGGFE